MNHTVIEQVIQFGEGGFLPVLRIGCCKKLPTEEITNNRFAVLSLCYVYSIPRKESYL